MDTIAHTHVIRYTIPSFDNGEPTEFSAPLVGLTAQAVADALQLYDAQLAGLPASETAGFDMISFVSDNIEAHFIIRTRGLGPTPERNVMGTGYAKEIER